MCKPSIPGYVLVKEIGAGASAIVFKAHKQDSRDFVAVKCFSRKNVSPKTVDIICSEIKILKTLNHPNIINMHDFLWDNNFVYIVMDYCQGGDLRSYLKTKKRLPENQCLYFFRQILKALEYLHSLNVAHMDLKPQNILLSDDSPPHIKVADFGLSEILHKEDICNGIRGSPLYMAPEILKHQKFDMRADVWSLGVMLYECLFGYTPFRGATLEDVVNKIISDYPVQISDSNSLSSNCADLLACLLEKNPNRRITFENLLLHPFLHQPAHSSLKPNQDQSTSKQVLHHCSQRNIEELSGCATARVEQKPHPSLGELCSMSSSTPEMKTALEIGIEGVTYDAEGRYNEAFDRYESAISMLLKLLKSEPKGPRQKLIQQQVKLWITRAEELKKSL